LRRLFPYKKLITLILLVAASVFLMNITGSSGDNPSLWEKLLWKGMQPFLGGFLAVKHKFDEYSVLFQQKEALLEENRELKSRLDSLESLLIRLKEIETENQRLKELLGFREQLEQEYKAADVIGRSPSKWFSTITISLGSEDGVTVDAPVISRKGLVGRVLKLDARSAQVLLLTDPESGVGALISRSRDYGVVVGGSGPDTLVMRFFSKDADVRPGDQVLTSGVGSVYPEGLVIGEVAEVYVPQPGLVKECYVKPAVDFAHLEEVLVMIR
jgi:rod shape-determining protein MreC